MTKSDRIEVLIVIDEGYPLLSLALVTEPLRVANRVSSRPIFDWSILSPDGSAPRSSSGLRLEIDGALDDRPADAVILLASYSPARMISAQLKHWLRKRASCGTMMGCVDTGALLFADAGLLGKRPAAAHREAIVGFREAYGEELFADRLYDLDGNRCSSAGGVATFDMVLKLIEHYVSGSLVRRVAEIMNYHPLNEGTADSTMAPDWSLPRLDRTLSLCIEIMLANLERPLSIAEICGRLGWPIWKMRRLFRRHLSMSPRDFYLELRLDRARNLLRNSSERVGTIALMCGFPATESLSRAYRKKYGVSPARDRSLEPRAAN